MQPLKQLTLILENTADQEHDLFSLRDLRGALPEQNMSAFKSLIARAEKKRVASAGLSGTLPVSEG
ncbi:MAG: hypothetical protein M8357_14815 [Desulfobulbaceae bacterium]|nr:hypothetical protein [Desulfobulbaceae bacterium]